MEADIGKRKTLLLGLGILGMMASVFVVAVTGAYRPVASWFHHATTMTLPINDPDYMYMRAQQYDQDGNPAYAIAAARRAIIIEPGYAPARKFLAAKDLKNQDYADAALQCKGLLQSDPNDSTAMLGLASAYRGMGETDKSEDIYRQVVENTVNSEAARTAAATALGSLGKGVPTVPSPPPSRMVP